MHPEVVFLSASLNVTAHICLNIIKWNLFLALIFDLSMFGLFRVVVLLYLHLDHHLFSLSPGKHCSLFKLDATAECAT